MILFADADGATHFPDVQKLLDALWEVKESRKSSTLSHSHETPSPSLTFINKIITIHNREPQRTSGGPGSNRDRVAGPLGGGVDCHEVLVPNDFDAGLPFLSVHFHGARCSGHAVRLQIVHSGSCTEVLPQFAH